MSSIKAFAAVLIVDKQEDAGTATCSPIFSCAFYLHIQLPFAFSLLRVRVYVYVCVVCACVITNENRI